MGTNPVIKSLLIMFAFWYFVLFILADGYGWIRLPYALYNSAAWCMVGAISGIGFYFIFSAHRRAHVAQSMKPTCLRGLVCSLGALPSTSEQVKRTKLKGSNLPDDMNDWFKGYRERYPLHANLMLALMGIYEAHKKLPASPVAGGHGGLSLQKHTENVLRTILVKSNKWSYLGHRGKTGKILFPLIEPTYKFNPEDPLVALCAYAHDLGKVECYKLLPDGAVKEIKPNHDLVSGAMLIKLPEFWYLPKEDRDALKMSVSYYHHLSRLPLWPDDRTRALAELLIRSDVDTGKAEGLQQNEIDRMYEGLSESSEAALPVVSAALMPSEDGDVPSPENENPDEAAGEATIDRPVDDTDKMSEEIEWAYSAFLDVVCEEGRINGGNKNMRIGIKHADWVYINDAGLRKAVSNSFGRPDVAENQRGQQSPFTYCLLEKLSQLGALKQEHNGKNYSTKRALFHIQDFKPGGKGIGLDWQYTIIFKTDLFPHLKDKMKDSPREPVVIGNGWGDHAALNKIGAGVVQSAVSDDSPDINDDPFPPSPTIPQPTLEFALQEIASYAGNAASPIQYKEREYENVPFAMFSVDDLHAVYEQIDWQAEFDAVTITKTKNLPDGMKFVQGASGIYLGVRIANSTTKGEIQ